MKPPIEGMKTMPLYMERSLMVGAWLDCVLWAGQKPEFIERFKKDTGHDLSNVLKASGLNKMIDEATGHDRTVIIAFADWVTVNVWGTE